MKELNNIKGVVVDWAGTMVDYGCMAPLKVFVEVFKDRGVNITEEEARGPMGLKKIDHIRELAKLSSVKNQFKKVHGREISEEDVISIYNDFEPKLLSILDNYAEPIDGALQIVEFIKSNDLKLGSTSGYTRNMMDVVSKSAKRQGYEPDYIVSADEVKEARPYPYMIYKNAIELEMYPLNNVVKIGDTPSDVMEGKNAGTWTIAILNGGSQVGMSKEESLTISSELKKEKIESARKVFQDLKADYIVESLECVIDVLKEIDKRIENGETPNR